MRCWIHHQYGLPRLDESGTVLKHCMRCGYSTQVRARLIPDSAEQASMAARRDRAIEILGEQWVGRPSNQRGDGPAGGRAAQSPRLSVVGTTKDKGASEDRAA